MKINLLFKIFILASLLFSHLLLASTSENLPSLEDLGRFEAIGKTVDEQELTFETTITLSPDTFRCSLEKYKYRTVELTETRLTLNLNTPIEGAHFSHRSFKGILPNQYCDKGMKYFNQLMATNNGQVKVKVLVEYDKLLYSYKDKGSVSHEYRITEKARLFFENGEFLDTLVYKVSKIAP